MKTEIKIQFLKIGIFEITKDIIEKEKEGLTKAIIQCMADVSTSMEKNLFKKQGTQITTPQIIYNVDKDLWGKIKFDFLKIAGMRVNERTDSKTLRDAVHKLMDYVCVMLEDYFKKKKTKTKITFTIT